MLRLQTGWVSGVQYLTLLIGVTNYIQIRVWAFRLKHTQYNEVRKSGHTDNQHISNHSPKSNDEISVMSRSEWNLSQCCNVWLNALLPPYSRILQLLSLIEFKVWQPRAISPVQPCFVHVFVSIKIIDVIKVTSTLCNICVLRCSKNCAKKRDIFQKQSLFIHDKN